MLTVLLCSCGDDSQFRVAGTIDGMGTQNIRAFYYANGALKWGNTTVIDGKFSFVGNSSEPTIVEIFSSDKLLLCRLMVENGQTIECKVKLGDRYDVDFEGNEVSKQWGIFFAENKETLKSGDNSARNAVIADYVVGNRDKMLSTVLMLTEFYAPGNELLADSLLNVISEDVRPRQLVDGYASLLSHFTSESSLGQVMPMSLYEKGDTLIDYDPVKSSYSLLSFTVADVGGRDTIIPLLKRWNNAYNSRRLKIVDIAFANDTIQWKRAIKADSAKWEQCWVIGSVQAKPIERLAIPRSPYFILVDSAGNQLYRGGSITNATNKLVSVLED